MGNGIATNNLRLHAMYIIGILLAVIVGLVAIRWGEIPELVQLITFGLTLASLFLALIAIFFAVFSNFSFSQTTARITQASEALANRINETDSATEELRQIASTFPELTKQLEETFSLGHRAVLEKLDAIAPDGSQKMSLPEALGLGGTPRLGDDVVRYFLSTTSYIGLRLLYGLRVVGNSGVTVEASDVGMNHDYFHGYSVAAACGRMFDIEHVPGGLRFRDLHPLVEALIEDTLLEREKMLLETHPEHFTARELEGNRIETHSKLLKKVNEMQSPKPPDADATE